MDIELTYKNKVIGSLVCSKEDYDCVSPQLLGKLVTKLVHFSDCDGVFRYVDPKGDITFEKEGNEPLMNNEIQHKADGSMKRKLLKLEDWAQQMYNGLFSGKTDKDTIVKAQQILDDKIKACKRRMKKG